MASTQHIAVLRAAALDRIKTASKELGKRFEGVDVPELEKVFGRNDPDLKFAQQLDLLAGVLEQVVKATEPVEVEEKPETPKSKKAEK